MNFSIILVWPWIITLKYNAFKLNKLLFIISKDLDIVKCPIFEEIIIKYPIEGILGVKSSLTIVKSLINTLENMFYSFI